LSLRTRRYGIGKKTRKSVGTVRNWIFNFSYCSHFFELFSLFVLKTYPKTIKAM
jgi:hypothetical protein